RPVGVVVVHAALPGAGALVPSTTAQWVTPEPPGSLPETVTAIVVTAVVAGVSSETVGAAVSSTTVLVAAAETWPAASRVNALTVLVPSPTLSWNEVGGAVTQAALPAPGAVVPSTTAHRVMPDPPAPSPPPTVTAIVREPVTD